MSTPLCFIDTETTGGHGEPPKAGAERAVARRVEEWTRGAHLVGVVPDFDGGGAGAGHDADALRALLGDSDV